MWCRRCRRMKCRGGGSKPPPYDLRRSCRGGHWPSANLPSKGSLWGNGLPRRHSRLAMTGNNCPLSIVNCPLFIIRCPLVKTLGFGVDKYLNKYYTMGIKYLSKYKTGGNMEVRTICLDSHGRRPVRLCGAVGLADRQALPPLGWCACCGAEVYRPGKSRCERCRRLRL